MASKILSAFSDPVFFKITKLRDWNLLKIIRYGRLKSGGEFYFQMRKDVTLMAVMDFSGIGMARIYHRRLSQRNTMEEAGSIVEWGTFSYRRTIELQLCRSVETQWIHWHVRTVVALH